MATFKQDLPPPGGYKDIEWRRVFKKPVSGWKVFGGLAAIHAFGGVLWYFKKKQAALELKEDFDSRVALMPFYAAEEDRYNLKRFRSWRDYESDLMKDVPGWKVGTYKGEELYKIERNRFDELLYREEPEFTKKITFNDHYKEFLKLRFVV